jgi:GNAT superfamily N-acetyltransferase
MDISKSEVIKCLDSSDEDEYDYHGDFCSINATVTGPRSAKIGHFVVQRNKRRQGYGSLLFESMLSVLRDDGIDTVTVEIQALKQGSADDPIMNFLREYGFRYQQSFEHHNWGTCVRARGRTL